MDGLKLSKPPVKLNDPSLMEAKRLAINVWGSEGTGKTRFLGTAPRPLTIISFERSMQPELWKSQGIDIDDVYIYNFGADPRGGASVLADVDAIIKEMVAFNKGTLAIDNGKTLWDLEAEVSKDPNEKKGAMRYGEPNNRMMNRLATANGGPGLGVPTALNFIMTHPATDEWGMTENENGSKSANRTGRFVPHMWSRTNYAMDAVLWLYRWPAIGAMAVPHKLPTEVTGRPDVSYWMRPSKFVYDQGSVGKDFGDPSFAKVWAMSFGGGLPEGTFKPGKKAKE